jgi:hypothetical protein
MQTSEVKARFRAEAAALGLAQEVIDKQWPQREKAKKLSRKERLLKKRESAEEQSEEMMEEMAEEEQAELQAESAAATPLSFSRAEKYHRIYFHANKILAKKLAPNQKIAEQMALAKMEKERQTFALFGTKETLVAFDKDRVKGKTTLKDRYKWLARYRAEQIFKQMAPKWDSVEVTEATAEKQETPRRIVEEEKDWADLAQAHKATA